MAGFCKVIILGRLGKDPEMRYTKDGKAVATLSLATGESWTDKNGEKHENTEWHKVTCFEKTAEVCKDYLAKGNQVMVEGTIKTNKWQDKDGNTRYDKEIRCHKIVLVESKKQGGYDSQGSSGSSDDRFAQPPKGNMDSDTIPF